MQENEKKNFCFSRNQTIERESLLSNRNTCNYKHVSKNDYCSLIRAFHISDSRWFFTEVWVTASLLKSPGLFLVFWQFSTMLSFGWSPLVRQPPSPLVPLVTVPNAPITIGIIVTCMFHSFLSSLARSIIIIIIIISCSSSSSILLLWGFFTPALADSFPLESEWQHVSSSFQDSS